MKCAYNYCKHGGEVEKEDAIKVKNRYWHKDCWAENQGKHDIYNYYITEVDNNANKKALRGAIKGVVNDKNHDAGYVLFALKYANGNGVVMNSPYSLHYIVDNSDAIKAWKKHLDSKEKKKISESLDDIETNPVKGFKPKKKEPKWLKLV